MSKQQVVNELYSNARKNFKRRSYLMKGIDDTWQADLIELIPLTKENKNYKYVLVVIDIFSKYLWTRPLKSKKCAEVTKAMKSIFDEDQRVPTNLQTDLGLEFYGSQFRSLMKSCEINHYSSYNVTKSAIVERVNRTIKTNLWREFAMQGNYKWLKTLPRIVANYNEKKHRTIDMSPNQVNKLNEKRILNTVYKQNHMLTESNKKFKIGDIVRISKYKSVFEKSYTGNWSAELFEIYRVQPTDPPTYLLKEINNGQKIIGCFYEQQLKKTLQKDVYLIEKIIRRRGDKIYVKWLNFDDSHNSWISKDQLI